MRSRKRLTLFALLLTGLAVYASSGCGRNYGAELVEELAKGEVQSWEENTDKLMEVGKLIQRKRYAKAQQVIDDYLIKQRNEGLEAKGGFLVIGDPGKVTRRIDSQAKVIDRYLQK